MKTHLLQTFGSICFLAALAAVAGAEDQGFRQTLFNGENLNGWIVTGCQAGVEDGLLVIQDGDGLVRGEHRYRDFVLELSYRPRRESEYDSGIYFRCDLPTDGKPWPKRYQVNLKQGDDCNLIGFPKGRSTGLIKPGEWNQIQLTVVGDRASMKINGQSAWETDGIEATEGFIAIQVEVPGAGQYEFKDIAITELTHRSLFNGQDLTGWEGAGGDAAQCWGVEQGLLMCNGQKGPWLRSQEQFGDFNLRLRYKLQSGGNSGVYIRVPESGSHHGKDAGIEIQVLDDAAEKYSKLKPYQYTGSLYAIAPSTEHVGHPPGEWNSLEIDCQADKYRVLHNGVVIVEASEETFPQIAERLRSGFLGLQNHSTHVWYRDVRIGPSFQ
ncbi:MAG: DUF1080 domain-containing protein [Planctomycetales bacterium]|nr:DUF1080 domain-containing protein [Planctomycetales bacterium]